MENVNDLKTGMDGLILKLEMDSSSVKQARTILNANQISLAVSHTDKESTAHKESNTISVTKEVDNLHYKDPPHDGKKGRKLKPIPDSYPFHGEETAKVRFILHNMNHAVSESEFHNEIAKYEGPESDSLKSLARTLRGMTNPERGMWTYFTFSKKGLKFYVLPEWKNKETKSIEFRFRADVSKSGLTANSCNWDNLIWHRDK